MHKFFQQLRGHGLMRLMTAFVLVSLIGTGVPPAPVMAQENIVAPMPRPGTMVTTTERFVPTMLKGIMINPSEPFQLDFIVDTGQRSRSDEGLEEEKIRLIKYFMASLTVPEDDLWVNLSPFEQQRIIPEQFGYTDMGRDLLAQDYLLKQLTATLMYPEKELGQNFWDRIYKKAQARFGTTDIPVNTFNKVWIIPEEAVIYEQGNAAYIVKTRLKVMLEEDYIALDKNLAQRTQAVPTENAEGEVNSLASEVIREVILPAIEEEVNHGKNFATLRQIYHSLILASWYKETIKTSLINQLYSDQNKVNGIDIDDKEVKERIYHQYIQAFEEGVYSYIKEEFDPVTQEVIPRKYFSGGVRFRMSLREGVIRRTSDAATLTSPVGDTEVVQVGLLNTDRRRGDQAVLATRTQELRAAEVRPEEFEAVVDEYLEQLRLSGETSSFNRGQWLRGRGPRQGENSLQVLRTRDGNRIVGLASFRIGQIPSTEPIFSGQQSYIVDYIEVAPEFRGDGYGRILLSELIRTSQSDPVWQDMPLTANPGELVLNPADAEAERFFSRQGFRELPRDTSDDFVYDSESLLQAQRFFRISGQPARTLYREGQALKAQPEDAERWARIVPLYEAQGEEAAPGEQLGLFPDGIEEAGRDGAAADSAILARPNWQRFVPRGIDNNPAWRNNPAYQDFSTSMGSNANALARLRIFAELREEQGLEVPEAFRRGAILGFGEGATELIAVRSAYNVQEVHGVEWVGDRVQTAAEALAQSSMFPNQVALHHANMADLKNQFGPATFDFVYAGLISDDNRSAPVSIAREIVRILQPGGYAFIDEGNPDFIAYLERFGTVSRWSTSSGHLIFQKDGVLRDQLETVNGLNTEQRRLLSELSQLGALSRELGAAAITDPQAAELLAQSDLFRDNPLVRYSAGYRPTDTIGMFGYEELPGWLGRMRLQANNEFYFRALQQHAPEIVAYARSLLDNPEFAGKKFVALGRGADLIYDAMVALTYLDSRYADRRDDLTVIDFSSENIVELGTDENISAYGEMFLRQISRQLGLSNFENLVFVNEVASESNTTRTLLNRFLDASFDYTAAVVYDNIETRSGTRWDGSTDTSAFDWLDSEYRSGRTYQIQNFPLFGLGHQYGVTPFQRFLNQEAVYSEVYRQTAGLTPVGAASDRAVLSVTDAEFEGLQSTLEILQTIAGQLDALVATRGLRDYQRDLEEWSREAAAALAEAERTGSVPANVADLGRQLTEITERNAPMATARALKAYSTGPSAFIQIFAGRVFTFLSEEGDGLRERDVQYAVYDYIDKLNKALTSTSLAGDMFVENMGGDPLENLRLAHKFAVEGGQAMRTYFNLLSDTLAPDSIDTAGFEVGLEKNGFPQTAYGEFLLPYAQVVAARRQGTVDGAILVSTYVSEAADFLGVEDDVVRDALIASLDREAGLQRFARHVFRSPDVVLEELTAAGLVQRNPQRGEWGFNFSDAFLNSDSGTVFNIAGRGERNYIFLLTRFMLEELNENSFRAQLAARGVNLIEGPLAERMRQTETEEGNLPRLLNMVNRTPTDGLSFAEPQFGKANLFARIQENILNGTNVSAESQKRNALLNELGPAIQEIAREVLASPNLQISISTFGSTLRGYADVDSDIEYKIHILSGLKEATVPVLTDSQTTELYQRVNELINDTARRRGETYFADDKFVGQSPTVNWEYLLATSPDNYIDNFRFTMPSDAQLFLPQIFGNSRLIEQTRARFIMHTDALEESESPGFRRVRWRGIQSELINDLFYSARIDSPALDRMKAQAGITDDTEYEDWRLARYGLPGLDQMREIYTDEIKALDQSTQTWQPALEADLLGAYQAYFDLLGGTLQELQNRREGDQVWFIFDHQYWDNLPANSMARDRRSGDFLIHLHTNEGDLTRGFMFRINPDAEDGEPIFDRFWIEDTSSQGFVDGQRFVEAGYITAGFAQQLLEDATAVMRQDDGFPIMDRYAQMRQDFYPLMQDVINNRPEKALFVVGAVQDAQGQDVLINIFRKRDVAQAEADGTLPRQFAGPSNETYPVAYKVTTDAAVLGSNPVGGIDLTPNNLNIEVRRDPNGVPVPLTPQQIQDVNINGLYPVIINTVPITNVPLLLGIADRPETPSDLSLAPPAAGTDPLPADLDLLSLLR